MQWAWIDFFRGKAVTIPPMDGALRPNTALDEASVVEEIDQPDNLVMAEGKLLLSSGNSILKATEAKPVATFGSPVTALATAPDGTLAIGLDSGRIEIDVARKLPIEGFNCPTALAFDGPSSLYVCNGSDRYRPSAWVSDLMGKNQTGSVWHIDLISGNRTCLARSLGFPFGLCIDKSRNRLVATESWLHRIIAIPLDGGARTPILDKLPGYPARISAFSGGYVTSLFAPRNRLIEFVLTEDAYRSDMMQEIDSRYWIAPSLSRSQTFLEPLQNGSVRSMGVLKPWSPSRSFGLVVELDAALQPVASYHSRANGTRHGVTSVIEHQGSILAAAKGGNIILRIDRSQQVGK